MVPWHVVKGMNGAVMVLPRDGLKDRNGNPIKYDKAYYIGEQDFYVPKDSNGNYKEYLQYVTPIASKYGGEYIVRAGNFEIMEGEWNHKRNVVIKFPSIEKAKSFYNCDEYQPVKKIILNIILIFMHQPEP